MPKKSKNGYFYFMQDFKAQNERLGRRFPGGMKEVADAASDEWKNLPQAQKDEYNKYAKDNRHLENREDASKNLENKFNSLGISFAQIEREKQEKSRKAEEIRRFVADYVKGLDKTELKNKMLHLIHVNVFCKTAADVYLPAELAICKFSIERGVVDVFHTFIDPGEIPTGYSLEVREHSDKFHKIKLDFVRSKSEFRDLSLLYNKIANFLKDEVGNMPPLFTMYDDVFQNTSLTAVEMTLKTLWQTFYTFDDHVTWKNIFPIYPLNLLLTNFKNKCHAVAGLRGVAFPNDTIATSELNKDTYNFEVGYACQYHQNEDVITYCSRSFVMRWAHIIRDHCCTSLGVQYTGESENLITVPSTSGTATKSDQDDDGADDDQFTDCQSEYSVATEASEKADTYSEASVSFSAITAASCSDKPVTAANPSNQSAKSLPVVWPGTAQRAKVVPSLGSANFPPLGMGRGARKNK